MSFSFQKTVNKENKAAIQGDRANQQEVIYTPTNFVAGDTINVGGFVWRDSLAPATKVVVTGASNTKPLGFVERVQNHANLTIGQEGTLQVPAGGEVNVAVKGDFFIAADKSVSIGDTVYANTVTGAAGFATASGVATDFVAFTAGSTGDMVIITNR